MATVLYFSGTTKLDTIQPMPNAAYAAAFGEVKTGKGTRYDSFKKLVGFVGPDVYDHAAKRWNHSAFIGAMPVTRVIFRKSNPSNHKCDARCRHAKGNNCECSCGGQFHGAGA